MNNRITIIILSTAIVLLSGLVIYLVRVPAFGPGPEFFGRGPGHERIMKGSDPMGPGRQFCMPAFMREKLELTEEQIGKITALNETFQQEHDRIFRETLPERERLRGLLRQDDPDMKQVRSILEKLSRSHVEIQMLRIRQGRMISAILTPEQNERLRREHRMSRGGMGPGPDGL